MADGAALRAMILAAGRGERLRPLTNTIPKPLVVVGGKPLIEYALASVERAGIHEVVINLHHLGEQIRDHVGDGSRFGVSVHYSDEAILQDTGGGIRDARRYLDGGAFVTMNADTIVDVDLAELTAFHCSSVAVATMLLRKDPRMQTFGVIETEEDGRVGRFLGHARPGCRQPLEPWMYTGVQVLEPRVFRYLEHQGPFSITKVSYPAMLDRGEKVLGRPFDGPWITVGTPAELAEANSLAGALAKKGRWTTRSVDS